ncbi:MAG: ATP-binding cassette domain-containing protein [Acidobacteria bacterium]|nr:MAG: ATP-binding cassette domain-containing protein [Acidobacteriota bacterium]REK03769.1 MAG: ATP-binding cassette domain-containing protein [Acidobacteriota bacterium]
MSGTARSGARPGPLLELKDLRVHFPLGEGLLLRRTRGVLRAVDGISLRLERGETYGLVGESGCGKSTTALAILRLLEPTAGRIVFDGEEITGWSQRRLRPLRRRMQMIYQDPYGSLNPRMKARDLIGEPLVIHGLGGDRRRRRDRVDELMQRVGLLPEMADRYPHEFSGGQRQRIGIARALALEPDLLVCDEPVSALDVSIQAQVVNLLADLQRELGLTILFIAHDLSVVRHLCRRIGVMYLGRIVEEADRDTLFGDPRHPYTRALLDAVPVPDPVVEAARAPRTLRGEVPSPARPPAGCPFHPRCPIAEPRCSEVGPRLEAYPRRDAAPAERWVACHLADAEPAPSL